VSRPSTSWDAEGFRAATQDALDAFIQEQSARLEPLGADAARLVDAAHRAVSGGKRFRAAFCTWGFRAVCAEASPGERRALVRAAASLEVLHASALVHDDYMDASDTRRGRPATHRAFEDLHREQGWSGNPQQYGAAAAILLGDLLLSWADELLRRCGLDHDVVRDALTFFDTTRSEVITGQFLDVSLQARGESDVEQSMRVLRYKSAKYSIERPLHVGAALAGADPATIEALGAFGLPLGEAFQLRDDVLGVFGSPEVTGKPAGDDLREGKETYLVLKARERGGGAERRLLEAALGEPKLTDDDVEAVREVIAGSGALADTEARIAELLAQAKVALAAAEGIDERARATLAALADHVTERNA
jgi:geranylgeranyl diphosphate synthase, type I